MLRALTVPGDAGDEDCNLDHRKDVDDPRNSLVVCAQHSQLAQANLSLLALSTPSRGIIDVVVHFRIDILSRSILERDGLLSLSMSMSLVGSTVITRVLIETMLANVTCARGRRRSRVCVHRIGVVVKDGVKWRLFCLTLRS